MKAKIYFIKTFMLIILGGFLMAFTEMPEGNKGKAKLVFLHERAFWGVRVEIKINNLKVVDLPNNRYYEVDVELGNNEIIIDRGKSATPDIRTSLTAETEKVYYLKIYRETDYFTDKLYLVRISEQNAKQFMKTMKAEKIR